LSGQQGGFWGRAYQSGVTSFDDYAKNISYPFPDNPPPNEVAIANVAGALGCAPISRDATNPPLNAALCPFAPVALQVTEVMPQIKQSADSWVEIQNNSGASLDLFGVGICQIGVTAWKLPGCASIPRKTTVAAGETLLVHLGTPDPGNSPSAEIYLEGAVPLEGIGELVLLAPGTLDTDLADRMLSFVQFGNTLIDALNANAVTQAVWNDAALSAREPRIQGESLSLAPSGVATAAADWRPTTPTPLQPNLDITNADQIWTSCSWPKTPAVPASVLITQIRREREPSLTISNRGAVLVSLTGYSLTIRPGDGPTTLDDGTELIATQLASISNDDLASGGTTTVSLSSDQIPPSGELWLHKGPTLEQYMRWGKVSALSDEAIEAMNTGLWPRLSDAAGDLNPLVCAGPTLALGASFELLTDAAGQSPPDFTCPQCP